MTLKSEARAKFDAVRKLGVDMETVIAATKRYADWCERSNARPVSPVEFLSAFENGMSADEVLIMFTGFNGDRLQ